MAAIVAAHAPTLKAAGFKKRRHSFNRLMDDGIVHVINFWQAPKEPPAWTEVPGLRERLYGSFRLDFGVYVPAMTRSAGPRSSWVNEFNCHLRRTIGQLMNAQADLWWDLQAPEASAWVRDALLLHGLPWLARFPDATSVLSAFEAAGPLALGMSPAGYLDIADVYRARGQLEAERRTLERYVSTPHLVGHAEYLRRYLIDRGHDDLASAVTTRDSTRR